VLAAGVYFDAETTDEREIRTLADALYRRCAYGFKAAYNPTHPGKAGNPLSWWVSPWHFGLNEGPIVLMIENYRSGLPWRSMRDCSYVREGLRRAGFTGGWLANNSRRV
jgi:hypothetical protein